MQRAWAEGAGLIDEEFEQPMIAVVNTCQEFSPENIHLRQVGDAVKAGIRMAGGTPCEFHTFHVTDPETFAPVGMRYVLPSRDLVADMIELMVEGHRFDAMVLIGSGDKVVPGMAMPANRLAVAKLLPPKSGLTSPAGAPNRRFRSAPAGAGRRGCRSRAWASSGRRSPAGGWRG